MDTPNQHPLSKKQLRRLEKEKARQERHPGQMVKSSGSRIVFWIVVLAIIGFFVYTIGKLATSTPDVSNLPTNITIADTDHTLGSAAAAVQLVEYADFQCPGCGGFHPIIKQLMQEYGNKVYYAYRHFPLPQHQHARAMARAAEAAGKQGKFFEMHDLIFENQSTWSALVSVEQTINDYANRLKLDIARFETDMNSREIKDIVEASYQGGVSYGVNSTPSFFINGTKIALPRNIGEFKTLIDQAALAPHAPTTETN